MFMVNRKSWSLSSASIVFGQVQELLKYFSKRGNEWNFHFNNLVSPFSTSNNHCFRFVLIERKGTDYCIFPNFYLVYMVFHLFSQYIDITVAIDLTNIHLKLQSVRASSIRAAVAKMARVLWWRLIVKCNNHPRVLVRFDRSLFSFSFLVRGFDSEKKAKHDKIINR